MIRSQGEHGEFRVRWYGSVESTNDLARAAALAGDSENRFFIAEQQTAGRGRHGRTWRSPPGNFYGSLLLRTDRTLADAASLSLVSGLAVVEAVHDLSDGRLVPRLKWPNDVLLNGRKLAGLLLEGGQATNGSGAWIVIGIGVNLAVAPAGLPYRTSSLEAAGCPGVTPPRFLAALAGPLSRRLATWRASGFAALRRAWLDAAAGLGAEVKLRVGECEFSGRFADLGADGSILLENRMGCLQEFSAGELFFGAPAASEPAPSA